MAWSDLKDTNQASDTAEEHKKKQRSLAQLHWRVFSTEDGQELLAYLTDHYIINNSTPLNSPNITYESGYHDGEAGVVKAIIHQMQRAEEI